MKRIPPRPDMGQLKKQAKELLTLYLQGESAPMQRLRESLPAAHGKPDEALAALDLRLHDAQSCMARQYGFSSGSELQLFVHARCREFGVEEGQQPARLSALNLIAHLRAALGGDLDRAFQCLRLTGYVNATPEFDGHSQVMNGASDLLVQVFGNAGKHTRVAVGVSGLPYGCAVEVEAIFAVR